MLALKNNGRKVWKWAKKKCKNKKKNQSFIVSHLIKANNNELMSSVDEKLKTWYFHYKFLESNSSNHRFSNDFWKDSDEVLNLKNPRPHEWQINQDIRWWRN